MSRSSGCFVRSRYAPFRRLRQSQKNENRRRVDAIVRRRADGLQRVRGCKRTTGFVLSRLAKLALDGATHPCRCAKARRSHHLAGSTRHQGLVIRGRPEILDWPAAVCALLAHLGLPKGTNAGHLWRRALRLRTAWAMPDQVKVIAIVSGAPPIAELRDRAGLLRLYRWMLALYARRPGLLRACFCLLVHSPP